MEENEKKTKRPDRATKFQERVTHDETVVKCCLLKLIRGDGDTKKKIRNAILNRIESFSKNINQGSIILSGLIKSLFENVEPVDFPSVNIPDIFSESFVRHLFLGVESARNIDISLETYLDTYIDDYKYSKRHPDDSNIYSFGAKKYITNLSNSLKMNLMNRIKNILNDYQKSINFSTDQRTFLLFKICGWKINRRHTFANVDLTDEMSWIIKTHRLILGLGLDDSIDSKWLKNKEQDSRVKILRYFVFLNREKRRMGSKLFDIVPIFRIKAHFITIDSCVLYGILSELKILKEVKRTQFKDLADEQWKSVFNIDKITGKGRKFTGTIESDGVSVCVHFKKPKSIRKVENIETITKKKEPIITDPSKRVIAIDPGRSNIYFAVEKFGEDIKTYRLTRPQYYQESGIYKARKQTNRWTQGIQIPLVNMSLVSTKGDSFEDHKAYVKAYVENKELLWKEYLDERWARQRLRLYSGKKRTFAKFFNKIQNGGKVEKNNKNIIIAYGSAEFAPGGKNEVSVPTTSAFKECTYRFCTIPIDEYRTTRVHHKDESILGKVGYKGMNESVRGLLWCSSTIGSKFVNRDLNAALNILRCATEVRPISLTRRPGIPRLGNNIVKRIIVNCRKSCLPG